LASKLGVFSLRCNMTWVKTLVILALGIMVASIQLPSEEPAVISGTVVNKSGVPVPHANVHVQNLDDNRIMLTAMRAVETDESGKFTIDNLTWGRYGVFVSKRQDGYPDSGWRLYNGGVFPTVMVSRENPRVDIVVPIGPKAGILKGSLRDSITGQGVSRATITIRRANNPEEFLAESLPPQYEVLLPPDVPVLVEVSAPGYMGWHLNDIGEGAIKVSSGVTRELDIKLQQTTPPSYCACRKQEVNRSDELGGFYRSSWGALGTSLVAH
jgi:hypothetical protein